jgi:hypothetical protein
LINAEEKYQENEMEEVIRYPRVRKTDLSTPAQFRNIFLNWALGQRQLFMHTFEFPLSMSWPLYPLSPFLPPKGKKGRS